MMKRMLVLLGILLCCASVALAAVTITEQPETQTVEAGGKVSFSLKATGAGNSGITWHFVSPDGTEDVTGRKLEARFRGLKVQAPNTLKITLQKVPEEMHGWTVFCHIGKAGAGVDSEEAQLLIEGMDAQAEEADGGAETEPEEAGDGEAEPEEAGDEEAEPADESGDEEEEPADESGTEEEEPADESGDEEAELSEETGEEEAEPEADAGVPETAAGVGSGTSEALVYPEIRGFSDEAAQEYQFLELGTYPYSENGGRQPLLWRVLYREDNKLTLITEYVIDVHQMFETDTYYARTEKKKYKSHFNDPYEELGIYFWLNGEMAETIFSETDFSKAILPHKVVEGYKGEPDEPVPEWPDNSAADSGETDPEKFPYGKDLFYIMTYGDMKKSWYGFPPTLSGDAIEQPGEIAVPEAGRRKTWPTPYAKNKMLYPQWKQKLRLTVMQEYNGTSPYWCIKRRKNYYMAGIVGGNGHLSWRAMDSVQIGVRPATRVDLSQLRLTGGDGSLKNPWKLTY